MTHGPIVLLGTTLLALAACSQHSPTSPTAMAPLDRLAATTGAAAGPIRPFGGTCDTDLTIVPPQAGDLPNRLRLHIKYVCQLQHLGRTTAVAEQIVDFTGKTTATAVNTTTYTSANGDQLFATWSGTSVTDDLLATFSGREVYARGTGRFVD